MATTIFISIGVLFNLFGCIGLIRLPDVYNRLQSATKCVTLGTCSILVGVVDPFRVYRYRCQSSDCHTPPFL